MFPGASSARDLQIARTFRLDVARLAQFSLLLPFPSQQRLTRQTGLGVCALSLDENTTRIRRPSVLHGAIMTSKSSIPMAAPTRTLPSSSPPAQPPALPAKSTMMADRSKLSAPGINHIVACSTDLLSSSNHRLVTVSKPQVGLAAACRAPQLLRSCPNRWQHYDSRLDLRCILGMSQKEKKIFIKICAKYPTLDR
jgi:hypothetical protein